MSIILDILIIVILVWCVWGGARKGFIKSLLGFFTTIFAFIVSWLFHSPVSAFLFPYVNTPISNYVEKRLEGLTINAEFVKHPPEVFTKLLKAFGTSQNEAITAVNNTSTATEAKHALINTIANPISDAISNVLAFILIFIIAFIALKIIVHMLDKFFSLPVLNFFNRSAGIILGFIKGIIIVFVICTLYSALVPYSGYFEQIGLTMKTIDSTLVFKFFYNINPINNFFK